MGGERISMDMGKDLDCVALKTIVASATKEKNFTRTERWVPTAQRNQMKEEHPINGTNNKVRHYSISCLALHYYIN